VEGLATFTATKNGNTRIEPRGNKFKGSGILIFRIKNGTVVELWKEFDGVGLLEQLGMELKPKEINK